MAKARALTPEDLEPGEVEILRLGDHHGSPVDFTPEDFDQIVADYDPAGVYQSTAVIDHDFDADREPHDPQRSGINHGLVDRLRRVKDSVVARVLGVTDELRDLVNSGRLNSISPELYREFRGTGRRYLRCVAFQGAATPAQKGMLRPILLNESGVELDRVPRKGTAVVRLSEHSQGEPTMTKPTGTPNEDPKNPKGAGGAPSDPPANDPAKPAVAGDPPASGGTITLAEVTKVVGDAVAAAVDPLKGEIATLRTRLENSDPEFGDGAIVKFAEELVRDGKIEGKDKDRTIARAKALRGQTIRLGEADVPALADYMEQERARAPLPHFNPLDVPGPTGAGRARVQGATLRFGEGKAPKFPIHVPDGTPKDDVDRLRKLGEFAVENGIETFAEASDRFEREVEGVTAAQ